MYDGGFRPDRGYVKCARVVGDVMGNYHPHGDTAIYDTLVRMAQPWSLRYPLIDGRATSARRVTTRPPPCVTPSAASTRWPWRCCGTSTRTPSTSCRTTTAARNEPTILPARFPNLLVNGAEGIAVGMATKIPPHNLREIAAGVVVVPRTPGRRRSHHARRADRDRQGPRLPDRRPHRRHERDPRRVPHRPRLDPHARGRRGRGGQARARVPGRHRAALPGQPGQPRRARRRPGQGRQAHRHRRHPRRVLRPHRHADRARAQARRGRQGRAEQPLQAHAAAEDVRREHAGAGRRRAAHAQPGPVPPLLRDAPDRGHRPPHGLPAAQGRGARAHPAWSGQGARRARRGHRADPAGTER